MIAPSLLAKRSAVRASSLHSRMPSGLRFSVCSIPSQASMIAEGACSGSSCSAAAKWPMARGASMPVAPNASDQPRR